ncbi:hypothetical protein SDC9_124334 [bioreactor metagenome]|uniref:Uncharacterized protein n=1 Tax=bioreactor metagenome TaxID=1076179 RepID=A0A645CK46_9ZZZZ
MLSLHKRLTVVVPENTALASDSLGNQKLAFAARAFACYQCRRMKLNHFHIDKLRSGSRGARYSVSDGSDRIGRITVKLTYSAGCYYNVR